MPNADPYSGSFTIPDQLHVDRISFLPQQYATQKKLHVSQRSLLEALFTRVRGMGILRS